MFEGVIPFKSGIELTPHFRKKSYQQKNMVINVIVRPPLL